MLDDAVFFCGAGHFSPPTHQRQWKGVPPTRRALVGVESRAPLLFHLHYGRGASGEWWRCWERCENGWREWGVVRLVPPPPTLYHTLAALCMSLVFTFRVGVRMRCVQRGDGTAMVLVVVALARVGGRVRACDVFGEWCVAPFRLVLASRVLCFSSPCVALLHLWHCCSIFALSWRGSCARLRREAGGVCGVVGVWTVRCCCVLLAPPRSRLPSPLVLARHHRLTRRVSRGGGPWRRCAAGICSTGSSGTGGARRCRRRPRGAS